MPHVETDLVRLSQEQRKPQDQQLWYLGFKALGEARGYKPGWPWHQFRKKFNEQPLSGTWDPLYEQLKPIDPPREVERWVKSQLISWAKRQNRD